MNKIEEPAREGFLYHLWLEREFENMSIQTVDGRPVHILEKGTRNYDAGPDFLNALVRVDGDLHRGDVEIHSIAGDWYAHGHHNDPRYNNVVLHIVTMDCPAGFRTIRQDGFAIPTLNLDLYLEKTAEELETESDVTESISFDFCALRRRDEQVIRRVVEASGGKRFAIKVERFIERRDRDSWDQLLYQAILEALGYSKNQIPFRRLAGILPVETLWRFIWNDPQEVALKKCEAYLFGAAGLLPSQGVGKVDIVDAGIRRHVDELESLWAAFALRQKLDVLKPGAWQFFRLRPANFPTRRIVAAAVYVRRFMDDGFIGAFEKAIANFAFNRKAIHRELEQLFVIPSHEFWSEHFSFQESAAAAKKSDAYILGTERARDVVVNIVLPAMAAYANEIDDKRLEITVSEIYNSYPLLRDNEITRRMSEQLFGSPKSPAFISNARMQQGLIHLRKQVCHSDPCQACLQDWTPV